MLTAAGKRFLGGDQRAPLRDALVRHGQLGAGQTAGRLFAMACVSLEITQRCNLDCTLCYLSDRAEMAKDVPLPILLNRIGVIHDHYGAGTSIQISGGDPTLRKIEDLEALCRHIRLLGMRSCLMTNGIKATRAMLSRLAAAGLDDLALHVDLTQERKGYTTEASLNTVRVEYLRRAQGLGLRVLFNTTLYDGNIAELPTLARFFRDHASEVALASFQMQADTGRGVLRERDAGITQERVMKALSQGMGLALDFDAMSVGHSLCNRYTSVLAAGGTVISPLANHALIAEVIAVLEKIDARSKGNLDAIHALGRLAVRRPGLAARLLLEVGRWAWGLRGGLWRSRGRVHRMSILVHNFMDATKLDRDRCESCVFMVATEDGPLSMCVHNAERDAHIFAPAKLDTPEGPRWWNAETGLLKADQDDSGGKNVVPMPLKRLKGRDRANAMRARIARKSR